jgi:hypothetical protein
MDNNPSMTTGTYFKDDPILTTKIVLKGDPNNPYGIEKAPIELPIIKVERENNTIPLLFGLIIIGVVMLFAYKVTELKYENNYLRTNCRPILVSPLP